MSEITELDMNKYLVLKIKDINLYLTDEQCKNLSKISVDIYNARKKENKKENNYLVLNLDDEISLDYLINCFKFYYIDSGEFSGTYNDIRIKRISVDIINAIEKAKERK